MCQGPAHMVQPGVPYMVKGAVRVSDGKAWRCEHNRKLRRALCLLFVPTSFSRSTIESTIESTKIRWVATRHTAIQSSHPAFECLLFLFRLALGVQALRCGTKRSVYRAVRQRGMGCKAAAAPSAAAAVRNSGLGHALGPSDDRAQAQA